LSRKQKETMSIASSGIKDFSRKAQEHRKHNDNNYHYNNFFYKTLQNILIQLQNKQLLPHISPKLF